MPSSCGLKGLAETGAMPLRPSEVAVTVLTIGLFMYVYRGLHMFVCLKSACGDIDGDLSLLSNPGKDSIV